RGEGAPRGARGDGPAAPRHRLAHPPEGSGEPQGGAPVSRDAPMTPPRSRCQARTRTGDRCRNPGGPDGLCAVHRRQAEKAAAHRTTPGTRRGTPRPRPPKPAAPRPRPSKPRGAEPRPPAPSPPEGERSPARGGRGSAVHSPAAEPGPGSPGEPGAEPFAPFLDWAEEALEFLGRRLLGEYEVDEFGHDPDLVEHVLAPLLRPLYRHWWRGEGTGAGAVLASGPARVGGNPPGTLPFDALMVALALLDEHPAHRSLRMLAADLAFDLPIVAPLARKSGNTLAFAPPTVPPLPRKSGNTLACAEDATRLLEAGELVGVWPEGYKGLGKPYRERYQLQRFGRGGFVEIALRTGSPIVPVAVVGSEEIYPMLANLRRVAR